MKYDMAQCIEDNSTLQAEEIEALSSIYGHEWNIVDGKKNMFYIDINKKSAVAVHLQLTLPETYPLESPPIYQFSAPWMTKEMKNQLSFEIEEIYCKHPGENILFMWIEKIKEFILDCPKVLEDSSLQTESLISISEEIPHEISISESVIEELPNIEHGEPITDRRSVFQAHLAHVVCLKQINPILSKLKENRKIATATHNIYAYRIFRESNNTYYQDCEDDGENEAGSLLLHLLQILDARDVLVVVSRWYGGVHLGSDRFKHINNAARNLLDQCGYIKNEKNEGKTKKKK